MRLKGLFSELVLGEIPTYCLNMEIMLHIFSWNTFGVLHLVVHTKSATHCCVTNKKKRGREVQTHLFFFFKHLFINFSVT